MLSLRPYQLDAVRAVFAYFERGGLGHPLLVLPTAAGKSVILAELARRVVCHHASRVIVLAHRRELLQQNSEKLQILAPDLNIGVFSAGLKSRDKDSDVLYCGIQTVYDKADQISSPARPIELVFVDEAHLVPFGNQGIYRQFLRDLMAINPDLRVVGCTATPWRYRPATKELSGGYDELTAEGGVLTDVVFDLSNQLPAMIEAGYLAPLWPAQTGYRVDTSSVAIRNGDFQADQLDDLMADDIVIENIIEDAVPRARADGRQSWLVFCSGVTSAEAMAVALHQKGVSVSCVTGQTPSWQRDEAIADFKAGKITALVSVNVLGVGFDAPNADCLIFARPTMSPIIHVQYLGRGSRPTPEKMAMDPEQKRQRGCLVLDYVGNVNRHGPLDRIKLKRPAPKKPPPMKECPSCHEQIPLKESICPLCGADLKAIAAEKAEKERREKLLNVKPIISALGKSSQRRQIFEVTQASYRLHLGKSSDLYTIRVTYFSGKRSVADEWICFDHPADSYPRRKAMEWFYSRIGPDGIAPQNCHQFLDWVMQGMELRVPKAVEVLVNPPHYPKLLKSIMETRGETMK